MSETSPAPKRRSPIQKIAATGGGIFTILAAWLVLASNAPLGPPKVQSKPVELKIDWAAVEKESTEVLQGLLQIPSVNPPGNEEVAARYLAKICEREGIEHQVIRTANARALLWAKLPGKSDKEALCLTNHIDVVPADPRVWKEGIGPFSGKLVDDRIYGRGALDMKGFTVMQLMTMVLIKRHKLPLERDLLYLALPDEEAGGKVGARWVVKKRPDLVKNVKYMWNEGGLGLKTMKGLSKPVFGLMHAERGVLWIQLKVKGPGGHGSTAPAGNAPARLYEALKRILENQDGLQPTEITRRQFATMAQGADFPNSFFLARFGHPLVNPLLDPVFKKQRFLKAVTRNTRTLTCLEAGRKVNVVPAFASAKVDIRLLPGVDPGAYLDQIKKDIADLDIEVVIISSKESTSTPIDTPFFDIIRSTVERLNPGAMTAPLLSPGGTDSAYFRGMGIQCYGLIPALFSKDELDGFHSADEFITKEALLQGTRATFEASVNYSQWTGK